MQTPLDKYKNDIRLKSIRYDSSQEQAVIHLQRLYDESTIKKGLLSNLFYKIINVFYFKPTKSPLGIYIWGEVGRGKTYLVDSFYDCLPFENKLRIHFHRFMKKIHKELKELKYKENPLEIIASRMAKKTNVLCFDEFHVSNISDAMILAGLLDALFKRGVILVTTSNQHPDDLYKGGLQRERFLPTITLLKKHTEIVNINSDNDYRLQFLNNAEIYHWPLDDNANKILQDNFNHISPTVGEYELNLEIEGRMIKTVYCGDGVAWFNFNVLCDGPRGSADYIEISKQFQTILLSNVTVMDDLSNDIAKRFIIMIDEFYDRNVKLIITAEVKPEFLYKGNALKNEFKRTISRLTEMQTYNYLAKPHTP